MAKLGLAGLDNEVLVRCIVSLHCKSLHQLVQRLPEVSWPFELDQLPRNGIYFFSERGEYCGHGDNLPRIVRVGTHREGNFRSRIAEHYLFDERKMAFDKFKACPKDRSIFRKNLGRALLHRDHDPYDERWKTDLTTRLSREDHVHQRNIEKEMEIEREVTCILRERFSLRWIELEGQKRRMGAQGLEAVLIGTLANCGECCPSAAWLGRFSPKVKIAQSGLWLEQHLKAPGLTDESIAEIAPLFG